MIDGNRDGSYVVFDHKRHISLKGEERSCVLCHHMNLPFERASRCSECHSDMYEPTDIFDHDLHVSKLGDNKACTACHTDPAAPKVRAHTSECKSCHTTMRRKGSLVDIPENKQGTVAAGYMNAMHKLCVDCHKQEAPTLSPANPEFSQCTNCHRNLPPLDERVWEEKR